MCQKDTTKLSLFKISFHHLSYLSGLFGARIDFFAFGTFWLLVGTLVMAHIEKLLLVQKKYYMQECIPVGCVPPAAVAVRGGCLPRRGICPEGCLPRRVSASGYLPKGGCLPRWCLPRGVSVQWGVCLGVCVSQYALDRGVFAPMHAGIHTPSVNRMTDRSLWKYYLATTSLRTVTTSNVGG